MPLVFITACVARCGSCCWQPRPPPLQEDEIMKDPQNHCCLSLKESIPCGLHPLYHPLQHSSAPHPPPFVTSTAPPQPRDRFARRHTVNVPPLPAEPAVSASDPSLVPKRYTMDFSLLSPSHPVTVPDSELGGAALRQSGRLSPIQVFCLRRGLDPLCTRPKRLWYVSGCLRECACLLHQGATHQCILEV